MKNSYQNRGLWIGGVVGALAAFLALIFIGEAAAGVCLIVGLLLGGFIGSRIEKK